MKKTKVSILLIVQILIMAPLLMAQNNRGARHIQSENITSSGKSYAIVVGISNYPNLTPLNYASDDALLFYNFLLSQKNLGLDTNNIRLFIDEEATAGAIMTKGISWLQNTIKPTEGDRVYFYLAGHGDAVDASEAYFLAYDANPAGDKNNYSVSGTINIQVLKNRIRKLTQAGIEVVFIIDACRTDDIPGGADGIAGNYESVLEEKNGELMMLSASPNQYSYEDKKFGNGHGLFTWHLVNGLSGKADADLDENVSLFELDNYVKLKVRNDSKQFNQLQTPVFCCSNDYETIVSNVNEGFLAMMDEKQPKGADLFDHQLIAARGISNSYKFDNKEVKEAYFELKKVLKKPTEENFRLADSIYQEIATNHEDQGIHLIREYYTTALIDQVQRAINAIMIDSYRDEGFDDCNFYEMHHYYLSRAIEINEGIYPDMYAEYKNRLAFLKINMWFDDQVALSSTYGPESKYITYKKDGEFVRDESLQVIKENVDQCNNLISNGYDNALVHYTMAVLYERLKIYDKSADYAREAIKRAPNWPKPYNHIIKSYVEHGAMDSAEHYALKRFDLDTSENRFSTMAWYYRWYTNETHKVRKFYKKAIDLGDTGGYSYGDLYLMRHYDNVDKPDSALLYYNISKFYQYFPQKSFIATERYQELTDTIENRLIKGDTLVSSLAALYYIYNIKKKKKKAEYIFDIAKNYYPESLNKLEIKRSEYWPLRSFYLQLGHLHMHLESSKGEEYYNLAEKIQPSDWDGHLGKSVAGRGLLAFYKKNKMYEKQLKLELKKHDGRKNTVSAINVAQVYSNLKDTVNAKKYLQIALDMDPYWYSRMYHISKIYKEVGELKFSEKYYERALELGYSPKRRDDLNSLYGTVQNESCE